MWSRLNNEICMYKYKKKAYICLVFDSVYIPNDLNIFVAITDTVSNKRRLAVYLSYSILIKNYNS